MKPVHRPYGIYEAFVKPVMDIVMAFVFILLFWWIYIVIAILVKIKLGSPVIFAQERPGRKETKTGEEKIFKLYKFRSMSDERNMDGELLPDEKRITSFGEKLRKSSLDELPEVFFNILVFRDMSWIGPRPLLLSYLPWYTEDERRRHDVKPGLTGLAQVSGRNYVEWTERLALDCKYVDKITFIGDVKIFLRTILEILKRDSVVADTSKVETNLAEERLEKRKKEM